MLEHIGGVESSLGATIANQTDKIAQLRKTLAPLCDLNPS